MTNNPEQLLNMLNHVEEKNLFLINNVQQQQVTYDHLCQKIDQLKNQQIFNEKQNFKQIEKNLMEKKKKNEIMEEQLFQHIAEENDMSSIWWYQLDKKEMEQIYDIYYACGYTKTQEQPDMLSILRKIELWIQFIFMKYKSYDTLQILNVQKKAILSYRHEKRIFKLKIEKFI